MLANLVLQSRGTGMEVSVSVPHLIIIIPCLIQIMLVAVLVRNVRASRRCGIPASTVWKMALPVLFLLIIHLSFIRLAIQGAAAGQYDPVLRLEPIVVFFLAVMLTDWLIRLRRMQQANTIPFQPQGN